jgi:DNA-binding response OmpR family regulator
MAKILIVEDEIQLADAYAFLLRHQGHKVTVAHDGEEGLQKVKKAAPDLILLDMMMPKLDGLGFLHQFDAKKHPEVILLSNMQSRDYEAKAYDLGVSRYEIKASLSPPQLLKVVDDTLQR